MKQSTSSAGQIPHILCYANFHHLFTTGPAVPTLGQISLAHFLSLYLFTIILNITILSMSRAYKWCLSFRFAHKILHEFSLSHIRATFFS